jgi:hypothetical protein
VPTTLILIIAITLGVVGVLVGRSDVGKEIFGTKKKATTSPTAQPIAFQTPRSFDPPPGDGEENDIDLGLLHDGNPATAWHTDRYNSAALGGLKRGVGVVLPLSSATELGKLLVDSPTPGWRATVYVADAPATTLAGWGPPVGTLNGRSFDLGGRKAGAVLLWITDLGPEHRVALDEVRLTG